MKRLFLSALVIVILTSAVFSSGSDSKAFYAANRNAGKVVALTFDDGPHPVYTPQILDILNKHGAKATFFVIGKNAQEYPEIVKRAFDEGHEIGNHTYSHPDMSAIDRKKAAEEIEKTALTIENITGKKSVLFRSPGGYLDDGIISTAHEFECTPVLWSWRQDTRDWAKPSVEYVVKTVLDNLRDGDIILFHDFNTKGSPTPAALEIIIPELKKRGYELVTVSSLMCCNN